MKSLVDVTLCIYHPGFRCETDRLEHHEYGLWLTPLNYPKRKSFWFDNGSPLDCVRPLMEWEKRLPRRPSWSSPHADVIFEVWAVALSFNPVASPGIFSGRWGDSYANAIEHEVWNAGAWDTFMPDIEALFTALDPAIQALNPAECPVQTIRTLTSWQVNSVKCGTWEYEEWDTQIYFEGLVKDIVVEIQS